LAEHVWSAAELQEESVATRTACENVSGLWVENDLRAHDDDSRVPVLANPHGRERPRFVTGFQARRLTVFSSFLASAGSREKNFKFHFV